MKRTYYDAINAKAKIEIEVNSKVAHFLDNEEEKKKKLTVDEIMKLPKQKRDEYMQREFENDHLSLNQLIDNGFQPCGSGSVEQEIAKKYKEEKYLNSPEYRKFRKTLNEEIRKVIDIMSEQEKRVMFLRFFREMSLAQIARALGISKGSAQEYVANGCKYIKFFLDKDIKEQDKLEKERQMKIAQGRIQKNKKNFFEN